MDSYALENIEPSQAISWDGLTAVALLLFVSDAGAICCTASTTFLKRRRGGTPRDPERYRPRGGSRIITTFEANSAERPRPRQDDPWVRFDSGLAATVDRPSILENKDRD